MTRATLIYCEGKTEVEYFKILKTRIYRIPSFIKIEIQGEKGRHEALIDYAAKQREEFARIEDISIRDISCWAVCDDDGMNISYPSLEQYADSYDVNLAFSRPQFESYLLQHFEQSKITRQQELYD